VVIEIRPPLEEPTVVVRERGGYEQVGDTEIWVPDSYTTLPAGISTRHARRHGVAAREAPDERERSADR
jgi:hypothetical protein